MPVENAQFINTLNSVYPAATDAVAQADDHIRLIKQVLKDTFPNINAAVTATPVQLNNPFPVGGIIMWSGATNTVPTGWALCNGQTVNRTDGSGTIVTPDMRDRFVVGWRDASGAGNSAITAVAPGATGGDSTKTVDTAASGKHTHTGSTASAGDHNHGGATGSTVLTIAQMPSHSHTITQALSDRTGAGTGDIQGPSVLTRTNTTNSQGGNEGHTHTISNAGAHTHAVTVAEGGEHVHSVTVDVRPKYFAVAFIMKV